MKSQIKRPHFTKATWCQIRQHFMRKFCSDIFAPKNYKPKCNWRKAAQFAYVQKISAKNIDEIDICNNLQSCLVKIYTIL